jgi:hypothetical protein
MIKRGDKMSDLRDKLLVVYLGIAGIIGAVSVGIVALIVIFAPRLAQELLIPIIGSLAAMGAVLGYLAGKYLSEAPEKKED